MALKKKFKMFDDAYHRIVQSQANRRHGYIVIGTDIYPSAEDSADRGSLICDVEHKIKRSTIEQQCIEPAANYYRENPAELETAIAEELEAVEAKKRDALKEQTGNNVEKVPLTDDELKNAQRRATNRMISAKAEHYANEVWEYIEERRQKIVALQYEILKATSAFVGAEDC
jgi:hypothetical protein